METTVEPEIQGPTTMEALWHDTCENDNLYGRLCQAVTDGKRSFPSELGVKVSIADCTLDQGNLCYCSRLWVPNSEPLCT